MSQSVETKTDRDVAAVLKRAMKDVALWRLQGAAADARPAFFVSGLGDGRTREAVKRRLLELGFFTESDDRRSLAVADAMYEHIVEEEVSLTAMWEAQDRRRPEDAPGPWPWVFVRELDPGEMKYLVGRAGEYRFALGWSGSTGFRYSRDVQVKTYDPRTGPMPRADGPDNKWWQNEPLVASAATEELARADWVARHVAGLAKLNLWHGVTELNVVPPEARTEELKALVKSGTESTPLFGYQTYFGPDPDKWGGQLDESIRRVFESITGKVNIVRLLTEFKAYVAGYGGWEKFVAEYRNLLTHYVTDRLDNPKPATPPAENAETTGP